MKVKLLCDVIGRHRGFEFDLPRGSVYNVDRIIEGVVYFYVDGEIATSLEEHIQLIN